MKRRHVTCAVAVALGVAAVSGVGCDAALGLGDPVTCPTPADVSTFSPPGITPPNDSQNVCTATQISNFYDNCLDPNAPGGACSTWASANATCFGCLYTRQSDPSWGALVDDGTLITVNDVGCADLIEGTADPGSCAYALNAARECYVAACDWCTDNGYSDCTTTASKAGCAGYQSDFSNACTGAPAACLSGSDFHSKFLAVAPVFCSQ